MVEYETFGEFFKRKRIEKRETLREFCRKNGLDAGNISRLERGRVQASTDRAILSRYRACLGLTEEEWGTFKDLADISAGRIPPDLTEKEIVQRLPVMFRVLRGARVDEDKLRELVEFLAQW